MLLGLDVAHSKYARQKWQEGQDGPGSLTWFFEITLANFFFVAFREEFTRIFIYVCTVQEASIH